MLAEERGQTVVVHTERQHHLPAGSVMDGCVCQELGDAVPHLRLSTRRDDERASIPAFNI
jgi:hypothetical protein